MKKVFICKAIALVAALMLVLTGCGAGGGTTDKPDAGKDNDKTAQDVSSIEMPTADLSNNSKVLKVFGWSSMGENETDGEAATYFEEEFGVTIEDTISTHATYWADLAKMVAAGNAPDVVDCAEGKFWPTPVANDLLQPWDGIIDFDSALWADTKELTNKYKWKGKTYFPIVSEFVQSWLFYNKNMFKNYGLEDQTPRALYERDEWTLDKMCELADMFIEKNNKNEVVQWGFTPQNLEPFFISGVELLEINGGTEYKNNLKDARIAKVMNSLYAISKAGSGAITTQDACPVFEREECAMLMSSATLVLEKRFEGLRQSDALGFAPLPKLDAESEYCLGVSVDPGYGLIKGAQNVELATLWVNYLKWFRLGENLCVQIPNKESTPAKERYNLKAKAGSAIMSEEDIAFVEKYLATNPQKVYYTFYDIVCAIGDQMMFKYDVFSGASQWSAAVNQLYPVYEAQLKDFIAD